MKIAVNAGHTIKGAGCGAVYKGFNEGEITRAVASALIKRLKNQYHTVTDATVNKASTQTAYLKEVVKLSDQSGADLFISIHCNASASRKGYGVECWTYKGNRLSQAEKICASLSKLGFRNRGIKDGRSLYVVRNTRAKAILIELFFLDNYTDRALFLKHGADKIAEAIAEALKP